LRLYEVRSLVTLTPLLLFTLLFLFASTLFELDVVTGPGNCFEEEFADTEGEEVPLPEEILTGGLE